MRVKLTDTSITFTTLPGHFDPPGSTIRFSTYTDALGNVILEQYARAWAQMDDVPRPLFFNQLAVEGANIAWDIQARQMQKFLSTGRMSAKPLLPRK